MLHIVALFLIIVGGMSAYNAQLMPLAHLILGLFGLGYIVSVHWLYSD